MSKINEPRRTRTQETSPVQDDLSNSKLKTTLDRELCERGVGLKCLCKGLAGKGNPDRLLCSTLSTHHAMPPHEGIVPPLFVINGESQRRRQRLFIESPTDPATATDVHKPTKPGSIFTRQYKAVTGAKCA
ncbi:hypothetical protein FOL47_001791, partial [Perkinsus chesapeaki]